MKKSLRKLTLNRDTLARLDSTSLGRVAGGSNSDCDSICDMITCRPECDGGSLDGR